MEKAEPGYDITYTPEKRLISAVLYRAIKDLTENDQILKYNAAKWLLSKSHKEFTFLWICEHLELDPKALLKLSWDDIHSISLSLKRH